MAKARRLTWCGLVAMQLLVVSSLAQSDWKQYSFADDGVSIEAPVKPAVEKSSTPTALGPVEQHTYNFQLGVDTGLVLNASPFKAGESLDLRKLLLAAKNGAAANSKSTASKEKDVFLEGKLGIEFELVNEKFHSRVRVFYLEGRLLSLMAIAPADRAYPEEADRFFGSLQLIKKPS